MLSLVEYISRRVSSSYIIENWLPQHFGHQSVRSQSKILVTRDIKYSVTGTSCQFWFSKISVSSQAKEGMNWRASSLTDTEKFPDE